MVSLCRGLIKQFLAMISNSFAPARSAASLPRRGTLLDVDSEEFKACFDRRSFLLRHRFAQHRLFEMERLATLAESLGPFGLVTHHAGTAQVDDGWHGLARRSKQVESVLEAINDLAVSGAWIKITQTQRDPEYAAFLDLVIREMSEILEQDLTKKITRMSATIFASSPGAVTPYHADHETNFLFQLRGKKLFYVFDAGDPEILSPAELEHFNVSGSVEYHKEAEAKATCHRLSTGLAAHNPNSWPHWAKTLDEPSIALSVNFCLRERDLRARVFQFNHYLRRLGIVPRPPGQSALSDGLKKLAFSSPWRGRAAKSVDEHVRGHLRSISWVIDGCRRVQRMVGH